MTQLKLKIHTITEEFFQFALLTYLILFLAETLKTGFISYFFNLNILIVIILIVSIPMVLTQESEAPKLLKESDLFKKHSLHSIKSEITKRNKYNNQQYTYTFHRKTQLLIAAKSAINNQQPIHVEKARAKASKMLLNAQEIALKTSLQYTNTHLQSEYISKILPYERLIQNTLLLLSTHIETDPQYNKITEEILNISSSHSTTYHKETMYPDLLHLQNKKIQTIRGKNEKLLEVYMQSLILRLKQLEMKISR